MSVRATRYAWTTNATPAPTSPATPPRLSRSASRARPPAGRPARRRAGQTDAEQGAPPPEEPAAALDPDDQPSRRHDQPGRAPGEACGTVIPPPPVERRDGEAAESHRERRHG